MQRLATIERIKKVSPHPNADRLDLIEVLGYQCVSEKGLYTDGDLVVYIKTDTVLPEEEWAEGYRKYSPKRVRAIMLRGEWSEGILLPLYVFIPFLQKKYGCYIEPSEGLDVTNMLGVEKYDPPLPDELDAIGELPYEIKRTDELRFEEYRDDELPYGEIADGTLKYDGKSLTFYYHIEDDKFGVTNRNFDIDVTKDNIHTKLIDTVKDKIISYCKKHNMSLAFRGELYGNGIQSSKNNPHSSEELGFACYNVFDIKNREYCKKGEKHYFLDVCKELDIKHVDVIEKDVVITPELLTKYSTELKKINGKSFEGIVFKHSKGSFKVINKHYDAKK